MKQLTRPLFVILVSGLLLSACAETVNTHGQIILQSRLAQVKLGQSSKDDVLGLLGSPSTQGTFNDNRWYYVTSTVGTTALSPYDLKNRKVIVIDFDPQTGIVADMHEKSKAEGHSIQPAEATTPTQGQAMGVFQQMFSNLGMGAP